MNQYYLISQLPGLDGLDEKSILPISFEEFSELCARFLKEKEMDELRALSLVPNRSPKKTSSDLVNAWNDSERQLRLALGSARAVKMKKTFQNDQEGPGIREIQAAKSAVEMKDPLEAELFLYKHRMDRLNSLRPMDSFSDDALFFYALKLMLLERMKKFDREKGIAAYQNIYNAILNGDSQER